MNTFPNTLSRSPGAKGYSEELDSKAVSIGVAASGAPILNELFTFVPITWKYTLYLVSQADKEEIMAFYHANRGIPFYWENKQEDDTTYETIFLQPPKPKLDKLKNLWQINMILKQYSPL